MGCGWESIFRGAEIDRGGHLARRANAAADGAANSPRLLGESREDPAERSDGAILR